MGFFAAGFLACVLLWFGPPLVVEVVCLQAVRLGTCVGALVRPSPCCGGRLSFCKHFVNIFLTLLVFGRFASCSPHASSGSFFGLYPLYMSWGGGIGCADWKSGKNDVIVIQPFAYRLQYWK